MVYIFLAPGFEEIEALTPCDLLRRAGVEVRLAGVGSLTVTGSHGIRVECDCPAETADFTGAEMVILPGGTAGVAALGASRAVTEGVAADADAGVPVAAICAAPTLLGKLGLVRDKQAVCYPGLEGALTGARVRPDMAVVRDGKLLTGRAAGASVPFALELVRFLRGEEAARSVAEKICWHG